MTPEWCQWTEAWLASMSAAGRSKQTIYLRSNQIARLAADAAKPPGKVTLDDLTAWLSRRDWSKGTLRSHRAAVRSFYTWSMATGRTTTNPALLLEPPGVTAPDPHPTPELSYRLALANADERERVMIRLATDMGLRRGEVAQVHARDVVEDLLGFSLIVHGKGDKLRTVPMPDDLARTALRRAEGGYLFPGADDGHLSAIWVGKLVSRLLPDGWAMHSLRHRFATRVYAIDRDLLSTQQLLGHASPATTQAYVRVEDATRRRLVMAVAA